MSGSDPWRVRLDRAGWVELEVGCVDVPLRLAIDLVAPTQRAGDDWRSYRIYDEVRGGTQRLWLYACQRGCEVRISAPGHPAGSRVAVTVVGAVAGEVPGEVPGAGLAATAPEPGDDVNPRIRTIAALHALGVERLIDIALTDSAEWPLESLGADPQFRMAAPQRAGHYALALKLVAERGPVCPVLYLNEGRGFRDDACQALQARSGQQWVADLHVRSRCKALRLDPLDRPGRFRMTVLAWSQRLDADGSVSGRWGELTGHLRAAWRRLRRSWSQADLVPGAQIERASAAAQHYRSLGLDPGFLLKGQLPAGWFMVEARLSLPGARSSARLYADSGAGFLEAESFGLPLRSGQTVKRLIWLDKASTLRFDPLSAAGEFVIEHLRIAQVSEAFALGRMARKLAAMHPAYRSAGRNPLAMTNDMALAASIERRWNDYNRLFETQGADLVSYAEWIATVEAARLPSRQAQSALVATWAQRPVFSIVMPTYNTDASHLRECLDSVRSQSYPHWELCIADDASTLPHVRVILREFEASDARVRLSLRAENGHIVHASNSALALASGDFVVLLDHDDRLAPHALFALAQALQTRPSAQLIYSDEDKLDESGVRCDPYFKPDWSPDLLYAQNYFSHLGAYRRSLVLAAGGFRPGYEGSQDYDLVLRCSARVADPADILHVPEVLYHWRMTEHSTASGHDRKDYASMAGCRALQSHADAQRSGAAASIVSPGIYRLRWPVPAEPPLVSLIIPTRDGCDILRTCIESILERTSYPNYEILVVDNQSTCARTLAYLDAISTSPAAGGRVRVLAFDRPFNYSAINNHAAAQANGSLLGLVNNDIEVINADWLTEMVSHAVRPDIGCVGAKLYYPDDTIQHAGVVVGLGGVANHALRGALRSSPGYFGRLWTHYNPSAVTGAVLLLRKAVFDAVGGLDAAGLAVAFNDVDLCLKVQALGLRHVWTPHAELYHHESVSRGADTTPEKRARFQSEVDVMMSRWADILPRDPSYNPNLTLLREDYSLGLPGERRPQRAVATPA